jgi:glycerol uptake facilitator-like aquaporin
LARRVFSEFLATSLLLVAVVGSGRMGVQLAGGNAAIVLLANSLATGCALFVLILVFAPLSGAHMNPLVTLALAREDRRPVREVVAYVAAQILGALCGVALANLMFGVAAWTLSTRIRTGPGLWLGEAVATFGLLLLIVQLSRRRSNAIASAVAAYIVGAYWFTSSTSFANPAVTLARMTTESFTGIRPLDVPAFVLAQVAGTIFAVVVTERLGPADAPLGRELR